MKKFKFFKVIGLFLSLILTAMLIVGCEEDPIIIVSPPPPPVIKKHIVIVTSGLGGTVTPSGRIEVIEGKDLTIALIPDANFKSWMINVNDTNIVLNTNSYTIKNVKQDLNIRATFKKTLSWYLTMNGKWKRDSIYVRENKGIWEKNLSWGVHGSLQIITDYLSSGKVIEYWNGQKAGEVYWSLDETKTPPLLHMGMSFSVPEGTVYIVEKLDEKKMILVRYDVPNLDPRIPPNLDVKEIFSHLDLK